MSAPSSVLDLKGLKCPLPVLRTRKTLAGLRRGELLTVQCTDPLSAIDIPHLVAEEGFCLENAIQNEDVLTFTIRKT